MKTTALIPNSSYRQLVNVNDRQVISNLTVTINAANANLMGKR